MIVYCVLLVTLGVDIKVLIQTDGEGGREMSRSFVQLIPSVRKRRGLRWKVSLWFPNQPQNSLTHQVNFLGKQNWRCVLQIQSGAPRYVILLTQGQETELSMKVSHNSAGEL